MTDVPAPLIPERSAVAPLIPAQSVVVRLRELTAPVVCPLVPAQSATAPLVPEQSANPTGMPDAEWSYIEFLVDDAGREYYDLLENTSYNPPSPGTRVDPVTPAWCANQWTEVDQDESTFPYPPTPILRGLAANGLVLLRMNVAAMCSPTRSSLLTGRDNQQHTIGNAIQGQNVDAIGYVGTTIYTRMKDQGSSYLRAHIGKWHSSNSYQHYIGGRALGLENSTVAFRTPVDEGDAEYYYGGLMNFGGVVPGIYESGQNHAGNQHVAARYDKRGAGILRPAADPEFTLALSKTNALIAETEEAINVIENAAIDGKPYHIKVWYHAVHDPTGWDEIGGANLSDNGYHSYGTANPGGAISGTTSHPGIVKAFVESVDTSMGLILAAMTAEQRANTMVVFLTDNGSTSDMLTENTTLDVLESPKPTVPASDYLDQHSKRSPWQGGIGAVCVINGPAVVDPGNGTIPRFWSGLCGVEDLYAQACRWTGVQFPSDENNYTQVLDRAVKNTGATGRSHYSQIAFQNGFHLDPWSEDQGGAPRFISIQNAAGWKLLWVSVGGVPNPLVTEEWGLYDMPNDAVEATDLWAASKAALGGTPTMQQVYDNLSSGEKTQFGDLYARVAAAGRIPPGMTIALD